MGEMTRGGHTFIMGTKIGVWIDHQKAVIVTLTENGEATARIRSNEFTENLSRYYDEVIAALQEAVALFVFGPGEAKEELWRRFQISNHKGHPIALETAGQMTDPEVAAKVRHHFGA